MKTCYSVELLIHNDDDCEEREQNHCWCHLLRDTGCGISRLFCLQSGKVWHLPFMYERLTLLGHTDDGGKITKARDLDWIMTLKLVSCNKVSQWLRHRRGFLCCSRVFRCSIGLYGWPAQWPAGCCFCCRSYISLIMTYPSRVCLASSFLFSSRSSGTRRRSGGPLQRIMRVPHRQSLLPVRLRTPAPLNRNARWRSYPT